MGTIPEGKADMPGAGVKKTPLGEVDFDILGEVLNISMSAAAKAFSSMLRMKVSITAPMIEAAQNGAVLIKSLEPALGVEIRYVSGVIGSNILVLRQQDIVRMVDILMGGDGETPAVEEFGELHESAAAEVMNQMMGAAAVALADMLHTNIGISVPRTFRINGDFQNAAGVINEGMVVAARFNFRVGDVIVSEMIAILPVSFAADMVEKAKTVFGFASPGGRHEDDPLYGLRTDELRDLLERDGGEVPSPFDANVEALLSAPLELKVEIDKMRMQVRDFIALEPGSIVPLERRPDEPADITVNGRLAARGVIVQSERGLHIRITEIVHPLDAIFSGK